MYIALSEIEEQELRRLLLPYLSHPKVQEMKKYIQHGDVSTYAHCINVVRMSFWLNRRMNVGADEQALVIGALLHDFYLYDWHEEGDGSHRLHGFFHPARACANAVEYFSIGTREQKIIRSHMWPLTFRALPSSKEAGIVCIADKYCSTHETLFQRRRNMSF